MQVLKVFFYFALYTPHDSLPWSAPGLVWLHVVSDLLIALSYLSIPLTIAYIVAKRVYLTFHRMFTCFGISILGCGVTHAMQVWNMWHADYWLFGSIKAVTAFASVVTAILLLTERQHSQLRTLLTQEPARSNSAIQHLPNVDERLDERRQATEALRQSDERFRLLVDGIADYAIYMLDPAGFVTSWNSGAERLKGYQAQEIIGHHFSCFYGAEDQRKGEPAKALREATAAGRFEGNGWRLRRDGTSFPANAILTALRDESGVLIGFAKITRDLTETRRAEEAIQAAHADLARVARASTLGALTASIAHEINQPLAAIVNNANASRRMLAKSDPDLEEVQQAVTDIAEAGTRAAGIISRIRSLLRKSPPETIPLSINQVIREVVVLVCGVREKHHVSLETELCPGLPLVLGDRVQLQQVLLNLIMNGMEAMTAILDRPRVLVICSKPRDTGLEVTVKDTGKGLNPQHFEQIFDTFFTTKASGLGMGLSISRSIIEAHSGRLWASRDPAVEGAAFHFFLPRVP